MVLLAAAVLALGWSNSPWSRSYEAVWNLPVSPHAGPVHISHALREWINDALMVVFFFVVGLEVKREFVHGSLSQWRRAALPIICALGGMLVPAALYAALNHGTTAARGWGIPMATDIAFALGILALAGDRVPASVRMLLLAIATADDIGAIIVIAVFYSEQISIAALLASVLLVAIMLAMRWGGIQSLMAYVPFAVLFWFAVHESGIHATIAGVVLGLITPTSPSTDTFSFVASAQRLLSDIRHAGSPHEVGRVEAILGELEELTVATESPADRLIRLLQPWSGYFVLPIFALANAGVTLTAEIGRQAFWSPATRGVALGLVVGKVAGIGLFAFVAVRLRIESLLPNTRWAYMIAIGLLGGIGFTVSLFITDLAFTEPTATAQAKLGVLAASVISGVAGYLVLRSAAMQPARVLE